MRDDSVRGAYGQAVASDTYSRTPPGLFGRYDNVYRLWEDPFIRISLEKFLYAMGKDFYLRPISVLDLGCGAGKGLELLGDLRPGRSHVTWVGGESLSIKQYLGLDLSVDMIEKARIDHESNPFATFETADLNRGLDGHRGPHDIYFSSYGTLSHLNDEALENLLEDIVEDMDSRAVLVMDMLGRYSLEWPVYRDKAGSGMLSYSMSHIMPESLRKSGDVPSFPMRFWGGDELNRLVERVAAKKNAKVQSRLVQDRSIFSGRHMDTADYGASFGPLRRKLNALHEPYIVQDLNELVVDYKSPPGDFKEEYAFFDLMTNAWNSVLFLSTELVNDSGFEMQGPSMGNGFSVSPNVGGVMEAVRRSVELARAVDQIDPVANIIQPIIALALRNMEWKLQKGLGAGHGLLAFYELVRN